MTARGRRSEEMFEDGHDDGARVNRAVPRCADRSPLPAADAAADGDGPPPDSIPSAIAARSPQLRAGEIVVGTVCPATLKGGRPWGLSLATGTIGRNIRISPWGDVGLSCGSPVGSGSLIHPLWRGNGSDAFRIRWPSCVGRSIRQLARRSSESVLRPRCVAHVSLVAALRAKHGRGGGI